MTTLSLRSHCVAVAASVLVSLPAAHYSAAQTTSAPPTQTDGETVELSPFEVSTMNNRGYVASESMTGSRVATPIIDLPYTVNVMTSEFFEDFALFELADNLVHIGSFTNLDIGGGFTLRGFSSTSQLRDGFYRLGRYGSSNVDRMEVIKGSNAAIYGRTSPGGMINMISKQPRTTPSQRLMLNYGDYRTRRAVLESTGPLFENRWGKTSYIVTLSQYEKGFDIPYARNRNDEAYLALKHSFKDGSNLFVSAEYFHQTRHSPNSSAPVIIDQKGTASNLDDEAVGYAKSLTRYNAFGPNSELNRGNTGFTAVYDKRLNSVWSTRIAGNYYKARRWDYNQNTGFGGININTPNGAAPTTARGATPNKGLIFEDGGGVQADLLAHYWLRNHTIENRTLVTVDINDYYRWDPTWNYAAPGGNVAGMPTFRTDPILLAWDQVRTIPLDRNTLEPVGEIQYFPQWFQWGKEQISRLTNRRTTSFGGLIRHQSGFMENRLLTFVGARFDSVRFRHRDYLTPRSATGAFRAIPDYVPGMMIRRTVNELKPNAGVNYRLTKNLRTFVNYSESYFVNQTDNPDLIAEPDYKSETAAGWDYGFKGTFLDDRLTFTVSGFYANRENVRVSEFIESPIGSGNYITQDRRDGDQLVRGAELDVTWQIDEEFSTGLSYGHVHSIWTDFGSANPLAAGRKVQNVSPHNGSVYLKYAPVSGSWKGFSANVGVTYVAETPTESPSSGDTYVTVNGQRVLQRTTRQWALTVPSFTLVNLGLRYTYQGESRFSHTFALNVNNLLDKDYLKVNRQWAERQAFYFTYTLGRSGGIGL